MKLFLPQSTLEGWVMEEKADVRDGQLVLSQGAGAFPVEPAVHVVRLVSGEDLAALLQKVKSQRQLESLAAEQMEDSLLVGDTAYEIVPGFIAQVP